MTGAPDSWIEDRSDPSYGLTCDDAGFCDLCGEHLDAGRCECSDCEREVCDCKAHCDKCGRGLDTATENGLCLKCHENSSVSKGGA